jgi:hypothetical protein
MKSNDGLVLLVEPDGEERQRLGSWLERAGFGVMDCPGPSRTDYTCLGVRGERCALVEVADLAILDARLLDDAYLEKTPSRRLLHYYLSAGKPVLILSGPGALSRSFYDDQVAVLRVPTRRTFVSKVRKLIGEAR